MATHLEIVGMLRRLGLPQTARAFHDCYTTPGTGDTEADDATLSRRLRTAHELAAATDRLLTAHERHRTSE